MTGYIDVRFPYDQLTESKAADEEEWIAALAALGCEIPLGATGELAA
jgi:hypothetical protein